MVAYATFLAMLPQTTRQLRLVIKLLQQVNSPYLHIPVHLTPLFL